MVGINKGKGLLALAGEVEKEWSCGVLGEASALGEGGGRGGVEKVKMVKKEWFSLFLFWVSGETGRGNTHSTFSYSKHGSQL